MTIKTLIEQTLSTTIFYYEDEKQFFAECIGNFISLCNKFSITYGVDHNEDHGMYTINVLAQKCSLDSIDTNTLFSEILNLFDYSIKYASLGGEGCNMSISVTERVV